MKNWDELPTEYKNDSVKEYYEILYNKRFHIFIKRIFDFTGALFLLLILSPIFFIIGILIRLDSRGPILFRQNRVTQYGKVFRIYKFRSMIYEPINEGSLVTIKGDNRITKIGSVLRKYRLDELPQLINIISGDMSFVGTRPEVLKYVNQYSEVMRATLLLPAGVTSEASIQFKDEEKYLSNSQNADITYVEVILPKKMEINLRSIREFTFFNEIRTLFKTIYAVARKE
nr:sugar transferase [Youngiibacter multivorans]